MLGATAVYALTLEPTASFWDCGEFIAVSCGLQVGHPPGAPFYQLLAHLFSLLSGGNAMAAAWCCNLLSAIAGGGTVMFLYWSAMLLPVKRFTRAEQRLGALVGALCYLFCDTAWFSAVESEVYSLAMLTASAGLWAMLRWYRADDRREGQRWLLLAALLLGLGVCTHLLTLLTAPAYLLLFIFKIPPRSQRAPQSVRAPRCLKLLAAMLLFFAIGLTPYLIIPIRAAAGTPINEGHPATLQEFKSYVSRDRYEKAPLYPRMWRHRENDALYAASWSGGDTTLAGNLRYYASYQLSYMYLRYLMWNFAGRYNDRQGYGSPQNGQFITGIPPIDRLLVGTAEPLPGSLPRDGHNCYYLLPLLLGLLGLIALADERRTFWVILALFLMGGIILNIYLNHPCYEPRERDYAYILSFYAYALFIAFGAARAAQWLAAKLQRHLPRARFAPRHSGLVLLAVPLLMACQNWDDHDRSGRHIARDAGANMLDSCDSNQLGAVLFTYGDNDTFPLWYLQSVEKHRPSVRVENIGLMGSSRFADLLDESLRIGRPVYFTHYAYNQYHTYFDGHLALVGTVYKYCDDPADSVDADACYRHFKETMSWHSVEGVHIDEVGCKFLEQYWRDAVLYAENNNSYGQGCYARTVEVLDKTLAEIPLEAIQDVQLIYRIGQAYGTAQAYGRQEEVIAYLRRILAEQLAYYHSMPPRRQAVMPYTIGPREAIADSLGL